MTTKMNNQELLERDQQGWTLNMAEYKALCAAHNVEPLHFSVCRTLVLTPPDGLFIGGPSNTISLGSDSPWTTKILLARANGRDVLAFEARQRAATRAQADTKTCSACGQQISTLAAMTSARGMVCPDCYDALSD